MDAITAEILADPWALAALASLALGLIAIIAARFAPRAGPFARALVMTALGLAAASFLARFPGPVSGFLAGFLICAALHRWADAWRARG